jgi:DNA modification methylase
VGNMARISEKKIIKNQEKHKEVLPRYLKLIRELSKKYVVRENREFAELVNFKKNKDEPIHRWFDYKQGYSSLLVNRIIQKENLSKNHHVLDPFAGVGTTNVVAQSEGFKSIAFDINPVATFAASVKCSNYTEKDIEAIEKTIQNFHPKKSKAIPESSLLERSFSERSFDKLMKIKGFFENIENKKIRDFFKLGYLSIIEDCSNRVKDGNGIKIVKNKNEILDIYQYYINKMKCMLADVKKKRLSQECVIINGSIINDDFHLIKDKKVGIVIFSPPYANCFDYCEVYKLELWMGDFVKSYDDFKKYRSMAMRSHVNSKFDHNIRNLNPSVNIVAEMISSFNIWNKNIPDMVKGYFDDMQDTLNRLQELMVPHSKCYIVVANSGYRGVLVPTDLLISEIAEKTGLVFKEIIFARKIRASSQQMKELHGEYDNLMRESIIVLEKNESSRFVKK